ncbi:SAF domain-containing protein [Microbacterium sp. Leaf351]|uniref:SAF domain-containing protein n=1 Tax=Microbacterium sp. Leaf351 TaxID=1736348 RepID=UPI000A3DBAAE|nr:SAF domain-containing protein [Microbacterium sp. Leaf351]
MLGIALVLASVAGVWGVIAAARQSTTVLVAARTILPGEAVGADATTTAEVVLGSGVDAYVLADTLAADAVATRTIEVGELVHRTAVGAPERATATTVVLRAAGDLPGEVRVGSTVDVWAAPAIEGGGYDTPRILVAGAIVVALPASDAVVSRQGSAVEVSVPRADLVDVLAATANDARVTVVPASGGAP